MLTGIHTWFVFNSKSMILFALGKTQKKQKLFFFSGPATKRVGGGGKGLATKKKLLFLKL